MAQWLLFCTTAESQPILMESPTNSRDDYIPYLNFTGPDSQNNSNWKILLDIEIKHHVAIVGRIYKNNTIMELINLP